MNDLGDVVRAIQASPLLASRPALLEDHGERRHAAEAALGLGGPEAHRGEGAFNVVGGANVFPVLCREVIEGWQHIAVLGEAGDGLVVLGAIILEEQIERFSTTSLVSAIQMSCRCCLARGWTDFGNLLRRLAPRASS